MQFRYTARDGRGRSVQGVLEAPSRQEALRRLARQRLSPVAVREAGSAPALAADPGKSGVASAGAAPAAGEGRFTPRRRFQLPLLSALGELVQAGVSVGDAVRLLSQRLRDPGSRALAARMWTDISEGRSVAGAMRMQPRVFEDFVVHLVEAGEATGNLKEILPRLTEHLEARREIHSKIASAVAYPLFLILVSGGVILFFLYFLLPRIMTLFESLRGELPAATKALVAGSQFLLQWGPMIAGVVIAVVVLFLSWRATAAGRLATDGALLRVPFLGPFLAGGDVLQGCQTLAVLLANGVTTLDALRLAENSLTNRRLRVAFGEARARVAEGTSLSQALAGTGQFPGLVLDMLAIGEQTGNLVPSLRTISANLQRRQQRDTQAFLGTFSTAVLMATFGLVGFIAYAIVQAVFGLSSSFQFG